VITDGLVLRATAWATGKKIASPTGPSFSFRVPLKNLKTGKSYNVKLFVLFTTGEAKFVKAKFKTCA
jgi:hypothetical protein